MRTQSLATVCFWCVVFAVLTLATPASSKAAERSQALPEQVVFNRDVRPILSDNCFYCHGPDAQHRQADLRLDLREDALTSDAFVPGEPNMSTLVERIFSDDPD